MNYVTHLNHWFELAKSSKVIRPTHICLYLGLFQLWNSNRFTPVIKVNRRHLMELGKIGSKSTFSNCMKDLEKWGLIKYKPTFFANISSEVEMIFLSCKKHIDDNGFCVETASVGLDTRPIAGPKSGTATGPKPSTDTGTRSVPKVGPIYKTKQTSKPNIKNNEGVDFNKKYFNPL